MPQINDEEPEILLEMLSELNNIIAMFAHSIAEQKDFWPVNHQFGRKLLTLTFWLTESPNILCSSTKCGSTVHQIIHFFNSKYCIDLQLNLAG